MQAGGKIRSVQQQKQEITLFCTFEQDKKIIASVASVMHRVQDSSLAPNHRFCLRYLYNGNFRRVPSDNTFLVSTKAYSQSQALQNQCTLSKTS